VSDLSLTGLSGLDAHAGAAEHTGSNYSRELFSQTGVVGTAGALGPPLSAWACSRVRYGCLPDLEASGFHGSADAYLLSCALGGGVGLRGAAVMMLRGYYGSPSASHALLGV